MLKTPQLDRQGQAYPVFFYPSEAEDAVALNELRSNPQIRVVDEIRSQVADLIKAKNPSKSYQTEELKQAVKEFFEDIDEDEYGAWVYYPWKLTLVHLLGREDFIRVRTSRNNYKITPEEQEILASKKIGIVGLSVGQSIAYAIALERGAGLLRLADFDTLELSNLNRLKAGVTSLGLEKVVIAAREISEIDPYLRLELYREGVNEENIEDFLSKDGKLDLLIDECDSLDIKVLLRQRARSQGIPVMMDTSDRGMLDIERFDLEPDRPVFHGLLGNIDLSSLKGLSNAQKVGTGLKITGTDTLSPRMKASLLEVGQTISSWPQLASAVYLGGASVAHVGRKLLLGEEVKSGRFYVDLDEIVNIDAPVELVSAAVSSVSSDELKDKIPQNILPSGYLLTKEELEDLIAFANLAPSGGNIQPWIWVFDQRGVLHLLHDQKRSHSLLDFLGTGSLIAFGAALENIRLYAADKGLEIEVINHLSEFEQEPVASIRFTSKQNSAIELPYSDLVDGVKLRCTNRKNAKKIALDRKVLDEMEEMAEAEQMVLEYIESEEDLEKLSKVIGGMDRMRLFHEQGLKDFIGEVRWTEKEAKETGDGIDIATLELSGTERAAMGLLKDPRTVRFFRKFLMGFGLTKISHETLMSSSAIFLLQAKDFTPQSYLKAGQVLQRMWIKANMQGLSFQPVTAAMFIFHKLARDPNHGFSQEEVGMIEKYKKEFNTLFNMNLENQEIFMFRLNLAGEPTMRSYRRDVSDTLFVL
ncbi:ThiF family protein [Algoriphagus faecimaris]|uniref:ThiF family protein n=1 Tax=Algoriphagus faecimaris TaxID=686796 RepID=A0A1G6SJZ9_9BACT|nr:Rv1355c family protein [Algoriphagus faecimaris]SDD16455.1 ThiF family protein [Algoriphagus faecimaris]